MSESAEGDNWRSRPASHIEAERGETIPGMQTEAYEIIGADRASPWLVTCDHASNRVPGEIGGGSLGLPAAEMDRHIAHDIGAAGVARHLADLLGAPAILTRFSRLVIDPNRGEDDPTLIMQLYDGTIVPGNRRLDDAERTRRLETYHRPYHAAYADLAARRADTIVVAIHSFTPRLNCRAPRPWHVGILHADWDQRLSRPLLDLLRAEPDLCIGDNQPYAGHLPGDAIDRHALIPGRPNALIELRHDLIAVETAQRAWAERLAPILEAARTRANL
jgi:predicted N-formylglutamate amidohydrolase